MDIALVTGADAGPGLAIARRLVGMGCRVYALATQFSRNPFPHDDFIPLNCDLADPAALTKAAEDIVAREGHVSFVVHAARRAPAPLLDSPVASLVERVNVGLLAPLALARVTLPWLRKEQGHFLVLCWNGDGPAPGGPVTAAIEGGLHHFADALFDELRSDGVRATTIYARPNAETTPEAALALDPQSAINPELVAETVEHLFRARASNVVSSLIIRPAALSETPRLLRSAELAGITTRDVQLPPRENFPPEPEGIPTPTPGRPADAPLPSPEDFADEEDEDEDDWDREREPLPWAPSREGPANESREGERGGQGGQRPQGQGGPQGQRGYDDQGGRGRGRGRRRGGRGGRGGQGGQGGRGPQGQGDRFPANNGPKRYPVDPRPSQDRPADAQPDTARDYPDRPEAGQEREFADERNSGRPSEFLDGARENEERSAFNRDDSFRTPHPEGDEDSGDDSAPREGDDAPGDRRDDRGPRDESFREDEAAPVGAEPRHEGERGSDFRDEPRGNDESRGERAPRQSAHPQAHQQPRQSHPSQGGGQQPGGGQRRHRGFGRRPPPGTSGRGPDRD